MIVRKLRLQRGWSQDQLAQLSGLSIRTIQRIERGQTPGLDSLKSLAAVFDVHVTVLQMENDMTHENQTTQLDETEQKAFEYVLDIKGFYSHVIKYVVVISILFIYRPQLYLGLVANAWLGYWCFITWIKCV